MLFFTFFFLLSLVCARPHSPSADFRSFNLPSERGASTQFSRRDNTTQKYVVAHFMVGNAYPYTINNWASDITLASASGIDGFALNIGTDSWEASRVADAYTAAKNSGTGFKLFLSFDMTVLPCSDANSAATLRSFITTYASHPNQLMYNGRVLVSSFSGDSCTFGQSSPTTGWTSQFTQHSDLTGANAVYFIPSFFVDPTKFNTYNQVMDGTFNWNSGWPIALTTSSASGILGGILGKLTASAQAALANDIGSFSTDPAYISGLSAMGGQKSYMAAVSPWFYTHYGANSYNKNWLYLADYHLYPTRWEHLIAIRDQVDIVEIVTWNDYGESSYIGPIEGAQPNSQAWVDGFDHTPFLLMTGYYAAAFKTGSYPGINQDQIYLWARAHPKDASASSDSVPKPTNYELTSDTLWALVMATQPSTVTLSTAGDVQTFNVQAGVTKLSIPLLPGDTISGSLSRNGAVIVKLNPSNFTFQANPATYNYNAFAAMAASGNSQNNPSQSSSVLPNSTHTTSTSLTTTSTSSTLPDSAQTSSTSSSTGLTSQTLSSTSSSSSTSTTSSSTTSPSSCLVSSTSLTRSNSPNPTPNSNLKFHRIHKSAIQQRAHRELNFH